MRVLVPALVLTCSLAHGAPAKPKPADPAPAAAPEPKAVDIAPFRPQLVVLTDGKQHYVVVRPYVGSRKDGTGSYAISGGSSDQHWLFYGDGKTFYSQRTFSGSTEAGAFQHYFRDQRLSPSDPGHVDLAKGVYTVSCAERKTTLTALGADEAQALLGSARFLETLWSRRPYWLARDERGRYYYVDQPRGARGATGTRLFVGPKGGLKLARLVNVVSDSEGDIFATKAGELRLITGRDDAKTGAWIEGKKRLELTVVPLRENEAMIHTELGVYTGERFGTPCDDS